MLPNWKVSGLNTCSDCNCVILMCKRNFGMQIIKSQEKLFDISGETRCEIQREIIPDKSQGKGVWLSAMFS